MLTPQEQFDELSFYTLAHGDPRFLHQNAVDAFAAQHADETTKPIRIVFALVGLYLTLEHGYTGREVQRIHMQLGRRRKDWPRPQLPIQRGAITVADILKVAPGLARDAAIQAWCTAVWEPYKPNRQLIRGLLETELKLSLST